jgi:serpin B
MKLVDRWSRSAAALALTALMPACAAENPGPMSPIEQLPRALSVQERQVVAGTADFGLGMLRDLHERSDEANVFISPLSASMALGMTLNGAEGQTLTAMRSSLGLEGLSDADLNDAYRNLTALLLGLDSNIDLSIANSLWVREGFPVEDAFVQALRTSFDAEVRSLDFSAASAPATINGWVGQKTNGRIDEIVQSIDPDLVLYLINAVWFKARWTDRFDPAATRDMPFHRLDGSTSSIPFMNRTGTYGYQSNDLFQAVDLSYGRGAYHMTVLVPTGSGGVDAVIDAMTPQRWTDWMGSFHETKISLALPRFRIEYDVALNETLKALGMTPAFDPAAADFSRITKARDDLYISSVRQKTFVEVNEEGTEAAAATSVGISVTSAPPAVIVDRPFIVAIRERLSGTLLFIGRIGAPGG